MLKRNCWGCKAHRNKIGNQSYCTLGYKTEPLAIRDIDGKLYGKDIKPAEECPKPRTWDDLFNTSEKVK